LSSFLINHIGRGGFAQVYKGIWKHQDVAIKKLNLPDDDDSMQQVCIYQLIL
jgi:serine/threonine protein kinase